ncbi:MAG: hypothetical protein NT001_00060 [Candidatus Woesearchaeota archaeon]|nr:hypothetical protein [Candidatus Woesearchaeota archaeon]
MAIRKSFFKERTEAEISRLNLRQVYNPRGLVQRILDLDPDQDSIELRVRITPGDFFKGDKTGAVASRKCYKHGNVILLSQPFTQRDAYESDENIASIIARDFGKLKNMREEEINYVGYSFRPVQDNDRRKRIVPFVWCPEAIRIFNYAENNAGGIDVRPFSESKRVRREGAKILCDVPSRTAKKGRYGVKLVHVPVIGPYERRAVVLGLKTEYENGGEPEHKKYNIRYTWERENESSDVSTFYPHEIAAYIAVMKHYLDEQNATPFEMNPFLLVSRKEADFYNKLRSNVVIFDPSLSSKDKLRKLHIDEISILIARSIAVLGPEEVMWNLSRDGKFKDYEF